MKTCTIFGDLSSEKSSDNYPTVPICDECVKEDQVRKEESKIVQIGAFDPSLGDVCEFCGKTLEEEKAE